MERANLPLFPLSNVVLFPGCTAPLHVFEPRYRQMTAAALRSGRMIGMVTVRPEAVQDMDGRPALYEVGCAGFIVEHQKLADGRYNLVLRGTHRFRIVRELVPEDGRLYRIAETIPLADPPGEGEPRIRSLREAVIARLDELARGAEPEDRSALSEVPLGQLDDGTFVNTICQAVGFPTAEKQGLLEAPDIAERLARLEGLLAFHIALLRIPGGSGSATVH